MWDMNETGARILVTGGAGYIGSHVVRLLRQRGDHVVIVDDLSTGRIDRVAGVPFVLLDVSAPGARERLVEVMLEHRVTHVVHFAAMKQVGESMRQPTAYFDRNVGGLTNLLAAMRLVDCTQLVFSSSAAVYGDVDDTTVHEDAPLRPTNPYGQSKLVGEWMTANAAMADGFRVANLRYFNVAGTGWDDLADEGRSNLVPIVVDAVDAGALVPVFGTDWATPDGTCVRDYIHVLDLATAHIAALDWLSSRRPGATAFNLGTGSGASVLDVVAAVGQASGRSATATDAGRRAGDPAAVVADPTRAALLLGWHAEHDLADIARSAWSARVRRLDAVLAA